MATRRADDIQIETSSGNVFLDLGLPNAEELKVKSGLAIEITRAVRRMGLTQQEAGRQMGISQAKVSGLLRGDFSNLSETKLMECLNRLGYDIEIKLKPAGRPMGHRAVAIAAKDAGGWNEVFAALDQAGVPDDFLDDRAQEMPQVR
jgi:predicted XRE-type DNA-binding protein